MSLSELMGKTDFQAHERGGWGALAREVVVSNVGV